MNEDGPPAGSARPFGIRVAIAALALLLWLVALPKPLLGNWRSYTPDSAAYVEASRSFRAGDGFRERAFGGFDSTIFRPLAHWPPGFPAMMAAVQGAGVPAPESGVVVSLVLSALYVALCAFLVSGLVGGLAGALVPLTIAVMPAFVLASGMCWSEGPYLFLSVLSLGALLRALKSARQSSHHSARRAVAWTAGAGLIAGLAWGVRYAGTALIAAEAVFLVGAVLARRRTTFLAWALGCAAGAAPFAIRDLQIFGRLVPYTMAPSTSSAGDVIGQAMRATAFALGGGAPYMGAAHLVPGVVLAALVGATIVAVAAIALVGVMRGRASLVTLFTRHGAGTLFACYGVAHFAVVMAARFRWQWGETIGSRHLLPVFWTVWIVIACAVPKPGSRGGRVLRMALSALLLAAIGIYLHANRWWAVHSSRTFPTIIASGFADRLHEEVGPRRFVLSTESTVLRVHGVNARQVPPGGYAVETFASSAGGALWGVVIEDVASAREGYYGPTLRALAVSGEAPGWQRWSTDRASGAPLAFRWTGR